jgi:hypothetical protein
MADAAQSANVKASVVDTWEETFKPGVGVQVAAELEEGAAAETPISETQAAQIFAELTPEAQASNTFYSQEWLDFYKRYIPAPYTTLKTVPEYTEEVARLCINIETTGVLPYESRLICIGVLDPAPAEVQIMQFANETEEATITEFVDWLNSTGYSELVGYNVAFDFRFLYALMQRYRLVCPAWTAMNLNDLQTQQKQVKQAFVPGQNKAGTLEEWSTYLLGTVPYAKQEQVYTWLKEGNIDEILLFNEDKVVKAYMLYTLNKIVAGTLIYQPGTPTQTETLTAEETGLRFPSAGTLDNEISIKCPNCGQEQYMNRNKKVVNCWVCKTPIASPL